MNPRIKALNAEFNNLQSGINKIHERAASEKRDLTDEESEQVDSLFERAEKIKPDIEKETERIRSLKATSDILSALGLAGGSGSAPSSQHERSSKDDRPSITVGEYLTLYNRAHALRDADAAEMLRSITAHDRAPVAGQQALADNAGVVPEFILGDLIKFVDANRYVVNSLTRRPMFRGTGARPRVTQTTQVGVQSAEFAELSSRKMTIVKDPISRATYGGYVEISEQDEEFSEPGMMQILIEDLAEQYAIVTDDVVSDALVAAATNTFELTGAIGAISTVTNENLHRGLWAAAGQVYNQCRKLPDTLWCSVDIWQDLGGRVDTTGRPLYPSINPQNAGGTMEGIGTFEGKPVNLRFIVGPGFANGTLIVGRAQYAEVYEQNKGLARGTFNPGTLSTEVGYRGFLSTYIRPQGFVRLVNAAA
jgi:HK97 family phage major capsid protein